MSEKTFERSFEKIPEKAKSDPQAMLVKANLKHLRLPTMHAEFEKLAREAASANESYEQYLLRLTELEVTNRAANVLQARIKQADFPTIKDFDTYDFSALPTLNKPKMLELARGEWIDQHMNAVFVGQPGTGKPQPSQDISGHGGMRR